jgi:kumamolisin
MPNERWLVFSAKREQIMPDESLVRLAGSERAPLADATPAGPLDTSERAELTLVLRRRAPLPASVIAGPAVLTSDELAQRYGADPADIELVRQTLTARGLEITAVDPGSRRVKVAGTLGELSSAFGTTLQQVTSPNPGGRPVTHRYREGPLYVPAALDGVVLAVLGLDTRPQARAHFRTADTGSAAAAQGTSYTPTQVADIYQFPAGTTGAGQTVAIIELGGGFSASDLDTYFGGLGIAVPTVTAVSVDGAANAPGSDPTGADVEVNLDIDVVGAVAPAGVLRAEQRRPGLRRRDLRRRAGQPGADRHLDQLGAVRGLLDRAGADVDERGDLRRGDARHHGVRGRGR